MKRVLAILVLCLLLPAVLVGADDPTTEQGEGTRLKRKKRADGPPGSDQKPGGKETKKEDKKDPGKDKTSDGPDKEKDKDDPLVPEDGGKAEPTEDEKDILERLGRNMRAVEEKLGNRELGEPTRQQQRDILKDIDALIQKTENPDSGGGGGGQPPPQGGAGGEDQQPQGGQGDQGQPKGSQGGGGKQGGQPKSGSGGAGSAGGKQSGSKSMAGNGSRRQQRNQRAGKNSEKGRGESVARNQNPGNGQQPQQPGGNNPGTKNPGKEQPPPESGQEKDMRGVNDVWGHLPESLRAEMNAYSNPQPFMPRYDRLIREYYKNIAEQGRKKGD